MQIFQLQLRKQECFRSRSARGTWRAGLVEILGRCFGFHTYFDFETWHAFHLRPRQRLDSPAWEYVEGCWSFQIGLDSIQEGILLICAAIRTASGQKTLGSNVSSILEPGIQVPGSNNVVLISGLILACQEKTSNPGDGSQTPGDPHHKRLLRAGSLCRNASASGSGRRLLAK